ncbi:MAG: hypothetical protein GC189_14145 [Alphaproteobacteria bacterium]|nr:hypothetical protein [Alphaproteobacteria bacterium]
MASARSRTVSKAGPMPRAADVRARARADGAAEQPPSGAADPSDAEEEILAAHADAQARLDAQGAALSDALLRRMRAAAPHIDLETPIAEARLAIRQIEGRFAAQCAQAQARAALARTDLDGFRERNGLRRAAVYPASTALQAGLLVVAAVFEALFSATLFAQESEQGLLGGAAIAVGLSGANVAIGFLSGFLGLRYLQHVRLAPRIGGGVALAIGAALGLALNWFAANWRQFTLGGAQDLYAPTAFNLLGLTEPQAVILLMLGGGVWVFAALKGYSGFDDPYPDYGKLDRAAQRAADDADALREEARESIEEAVDACGKTVRIALSTVQKAADGRIAAFDEAAAALSALDEQSRACAASAADLVAEYRRANAAARSTPIPEDVSSPRLQGAPPRIDRLTAASDALDAARREDAQTQALAADHLQRLAQDMEDACSRLGGRSP